MNLNENLSQYSTENADSVHKKPVCLFAKYIVLTMM